MRFIIVSQLYWPIWFCFVAAGMPRVGIAISAVITASLLALTWYLTWGSFKGLTPNSR